MKTENCDDTLKKSQFKNVIKKIETKSEQQRDNNEGKKLKRTCQSMKTNIPEEK